MFWLAVFYSVFYTVVATVGKFALGLWLALLLNNHLPFKTLLRAIILLPWIVPTVLSAHRLLVDLRSAVLDHLLSSLVDVLRHAHRAYSTSSSTTWPARWSLIAANIWRGIPFVAISLLAGLQTISPSLYEAALLDGATGLAALPLHHLPAAAADPGDRDDLLDHLHLHRLPARLRHHARRTGQLDPSDGDARLPARHRRRRAGRGRGDRRRR